MQVYNNQQSFCIKYLSLIVNYQYHIISYTILITFRISVVKLHYSNLQQEGANFNTDARSLIRIISIFCELFPSDTKLFVKMEANLAFTC